MEECCVIGRLGLQHGWLRSRYCAIQPLHYNFPIYKSIRLPQTHHERHRPQISIPEKQC